MNPSPTGDGGSDGPSTGTIVGAVIGALAGVAAIVGALIIGFRMGRRHSPPDNQEAGTKKSFKDTLSSLPRPTISWTRPGTKKSLGSGEQNAVSVHQANFPDDATRTSTMGPAELPNPVSHRPDNQAHTLQPINTQNRPAAGVEYSQAELSTGLEAQVWARSESRPWPYEVDATMERGVSP